MSKSKNLPGTLLLFLAGALTISWALTFREFLLVIFDTATQAEITRQIIVLSILSVMVIGLGAAGYYKHRKR